LKARSALAVVFGAITTAVGSVNVAAAVTPLPMEQVTAFAQLPADVDSEVRPLGASGEKYLTGRSWRPGCPVELTDLRVVMVRFVNFEGNGSQGPLIVHRKHAKKIATVMETLYRNQFRIAQIRPVDEFEADDDLSTLANNTSAFNCRKAYGTKNWSQHAYGSAIDINPVQNPYVRPNGTVLDPEAARYLERAAVPGLILKNDVVVKSFAKMGWSWGGTWKSPKDYQHFSASGR
jgi:hypothetical protein